MRERICKISLFSAILASITTLPVDARVNINNSNRSYADAYNQVNMLRYQQEYVAATEAATANNLPVMVSDEKLASEIANNTSETTIGDLDTCAMIWPNGSFRWEIPESGVRRNPVNQCVAVISLINGKTKEVLATTTVAAGDTMKCNIDYFPESGMNKAVVERTILPTDAAPTIKDVEAVMNEEQKQNAGIKIAAGAIIAGVAGNMLSKKAPGDSKMFGTSKDQLIGTAAGVATGASIMAAGSYSGKVAGDTITSTAVNAASGMIVGNMLAGANGGGDDYLEIKTCKVTNDTEYGGEHDCISGQIQIKGASIPNSNDGNIIIYLVNDKGNAKKCKQYTEDTNKYECEEDKKLMNIKLSYNSSAKPFESIFGSSVQNREFSNLERYYLNTENDLFEKYADTDPQKDNTYYRVASATEVKGTKPAYAVFKNKIGKNKKWSDLQGSDYVYFNRNSDGSVGSRIDNSNNNIDHTDFKPFTKDAEDGGLIDLSNQARVKGTLVGTAAGGAMGGFAGYQGAKSEITDRWTTAVREYEDSLSNFACTSGSRYLSKYNDYIEVPELKKTEE